MTVVRFSIIIIAVTASALGNYREPGTASAGASSNPPATSSPEPGREKQKPPNKEQDNTQPVFAQGENKFNR